MPQILQPMASLRHFSALPKNSLCSNSFASTEKYSDGLVCTRLYLKNENYILNYLKTLGLYLLLEKFIINSLLMENSIKLRLYNKKNLNKLDLIRKAILVNLVKK